jgi:hypothetical protein
MGGGIAAKDYYIIKLDRYLQDGRLPPGGE